MIYKHVVVVTILSEDAELEAVLGREWELPDLHEAITTGACIGSFEHTASGIVPPKDVEKELIALGNDGTFFSALDGD